MKVKTGIMIASLAAATLLPFSSNGQNKKNNIATQTNKELSESITNREIVDYKGKRLLIKESHEEVINMPVKKMLEKYKENFESIYMYHMLAEINKRRELLWLKPLIRDHILINISKEFSKYLSENHALWHELNGKTWFNLSEKDIKKYKLIRENVTCESENATIFDIVDNRQYLDDKRDSIRWEKRPKEKNHKYLIIWDDVDVFWWWITVDNKSNNDIYVVVKSWWLF